MELPPEKAQKLFRKAYKGAGVLQILFCECDNYTYGGLKKMGFTRTQTLGTGGELCDFIMYRKRRSCDAD